MSPPSYSKENLFVSHAWSALVCYRDIPVLHASVRHVEISPGESQKRSKPQRSKFKFDLSELERQTDGDYDISRLLVPREWTQNDESETNGTRKLPRPLSA